MTHSLEPVGFRRGREIFVFLSAMMGAMAADLLFRGDTGQALMFAMVAVTCIEPMSERPRSAVRVPTTVFGALGIAFWLALRYGVPAIMRVLA